MTGPTRSIMRFANQRHPRAIGDLSAMEQAQLIACGTAYDGRVATAAELLPDPDDEEQGLFRLELWDVVDDDGTVVYNLWLYFVDAGTLFRAGSTEQVAAFAQFSLECRDPALARELAAAHAAHPAWPAETVLSRMRS